MVREVSEAKRNISGIENLFGLVINKPYLCKHN